MEAFEMDTFNDNFDIERNIQEEESFFINAFDENDFDNDDDFIDSLDFDNQTEQNLRNERQKQNEVERKEALTEVERKENLNKWEAQQRRRITQTRKTFFRNAFDQEVVMKDGPESKKLVSKSLISVNSKSGKVDGILFDGVNVVVKKGKNFVLSTNEKFKGKVNEFNELMKRARLEHERTANDSIENIIDDLPGTSSINGIRENVINRIQSEITLSRDNLDTTLLTNEELRELGGILATKRIENLDAVDIAVKYWKDKSDEEVDPRRKAVKLAISNLSKLKGDEMRLKHNIKPLYQETLDLIENDDITKFEKFKKYAKENLGVLSAVAIGIAGIITTVIIAGRKGVIAGAKATGALGKAVGKLGKAALPILVPLVNVLVTALTWGAKGMAWLAKNMWALAIVLTYIMYEYAKRKIKKRYNK